MWFSQRLVLDKVKSHTRRPGGFRSQADRRFSGHRCRLERLEERMVLSGGVVTTSLSTGPDFARAGLVVGDNLDKIVVAGFANGDSALVRYNSDGTLDSSFGTQGVTITPMAANNGDHWRTLASSPGNKLVAGGICDTGADSNQIDFTLARFNANGTLDTTFGSRGKVKTSFGTTDLLNAVVVLQSDYIAPDLSFSVPAGTIYAGGHNGTIGETHKTLLARYTASGKLDTSFGSGGLATDKVPAGEALGLTVWNRGGDLRILQTGSTTSNHLVLVCYKLDGNLDTGFDGDGVLLSDLAPVSQEGQHGNAVAVDALGRILVGGYAYQSGTTIGSDFAIACYKSNGSLDPSFGAGKGYVLTDFEVGGSEDARSITVDPATNNIAVAGVTDWNNPQFAVALYNSLGTPLAHTTTTIGSRSEAYQIAFLPASTGHAGGRIIVAGKASMPTGSGDKIDIALACYDALTLTPDPDFPPPAGITVTPTSGLLTTEARGTDSFTVVLNSAPTANVTIPVWSNDTTEGTVSVSSLTFTPANWYVAQKVMVRGVDDRIRDLDQLYTIILDKATSSDPAYNGRDPTDVSVINKDNETGTLAAASASLTDAALADLAGSDFQSHKKTKSSPAQSIFADDPAMMLFE